MRPIVFVAGARPNFMKVAPVLRALAARTTGPQKLLVHTGQHYDPVMSEVFFRELGIPEPDAHLRVGSGSHAQQTAGVLTRFESYLQGLPRAPAGVVVVGDVNSTLAAALAAVKLGIPVAHVEAGLRSFDRAMPEEINRLATDAISDLLLVSEPSGEANLIREGADQARIHYVGNVMIDTLVHERAAARQLDAPGARGLADTPYAVVTLHRPSNVDSPERLATIVDFLVWTAQRLPLVFPAHPRTRTRLREFALAERLAEGARLRLEDPVGYRELLGLMDGAAVVITDSGGIQEETSFLGVPCLTVRENTERPATITSGTNTLVGGDFARARELVAELSAQAGTPDRPACAIPGWDGRAGERVAEILVAEWSGRG